MAAGHLNLSILVKFQTELMGMLPGEVMEFRMPGRQPIQVKCLDGVYRRGDELFIILLGGDVWRNAPSTACGLYYIFAA